MRSANFIFLTVLLFGCTFIDAYSQRDPCIICEPCLYMEFTVESNDQTTKSLQRKKVDISLVDPSLAKYWKESKEDFRTKSTKVKEQLNRNKESNVASYYIDPCDSGGGGCSVDMPYASNTSRCGPGSITLNASPGWGGNAVYWYETNISSVPIGYQSNLTVTVSSSRYYYVSTYDTYTGCESSRRAVHVAINAVPGYAYGQHKYRIGPGSITLTATPASGANTVRWYASNTGGPVLATSTSYTTPYLTETTSYYVSSYNSSTGCESPNRSMVSVTIGDCNTFNEFHVYRGYPTQVCSPQTVNFIAEHDYEYGDINGEFRWYTTATSPTPVHTQAEGYSQYSFYATGSYTMWASFYDYNLNCETSRKSITFSFDQPPSILPQYSYRCGDGNAKIQLNSNTSGVTFHLYKLVEYYNPGSGWVSDYQLVSSNSSGYFEVSNFDNNDQENYYVKATKTGACLMTNYYQLNIDIYDVSSPVIYSGTPVVCEGTSTILSATGQAYSYKWFNETGVLMQNGEDFVVPSNLSAGDHNYFVKGYYYNGCETNPRNFVVTVNPRPVDGTITANVNTICLGQSVLVSSSGGSGTPHYYCSSNEGESWNVFQNQYVGQSSFWFTPQSTGTYRFHLRNSTDCGFCYDPGNNGCPEFPFVDVTVVNPPEVTINVSVPSATLFQASTTLTANLSGEGYTYQWYYNNNPIPGATLLSYNSKKAGTYKVAATNSLGCTSTSASLSLENDGFNQNYIITNTVLVPNIIEESLIPTYYNTVAKIQQSITYFDGLGRPIQSVVTQGSPNKNDIVFPVEYDAFGREAKKYLPYVHDASNGWYKDDAVTQQGNFYRQANPMSKIAVDAAPYALTVYEASPLNRIIKQGAPGAEWQPDGINTYNSSDHTIKNVYEFNTIGEVLRWSYSHPSASNSFGLIDAGLTASPTYYSPNQLYKNKTKDEHGKEVIVYTDTEGRIVLKRTQATNSQVPVNDSNFASTYYIYDDFGNLVCEIQPEGVKNIEDYFNADDSGKEKFLNNWAFRYKYDGRRRMVEKQIPGGALLYVVYDRRDRVVLTQDGNQRGENKWSFIKYDALNRPIITGVYVHDGSVGQAEMNELISATNFFDTYNGSVSFHGYTNNVFPTDNANNSPLEIYTVTYYDNYNFRDDFIGSTYNYVLGDVTGQPAASNRVVGWVTGTKTNVLNTNDFLWSVNYYDDNYRSIQTITKNHKGGIDRVTNKVDFVGKVLETKTTRSNGTSSSIIKERYEYDHAGRLLKTYHQLNSEPEILLSSLEYNEIGQLVTKKLHAVNSTTFKQHIDYRYNIRGWITRINNADLNTSDDGPKDYFGMEFGYNNDLGIGTFTPQYNGNISATKWSANLGLALPYLNEPTERGYKYAYDPLDRLMKADHAFKNGNWLVSSANKEIVSYDLNGNIETLFRSDSRGAVIDWLVYDYGNGLNRSNRLLSVTDNSSGIDGFKDGNISGNDYEYDANGSLIADKNKSIENIKYNPYLNLTEEIEKGSGEKVKYIYDADGIKLAEEIYQADAQTPVKRLDYMGPLVYENDTLKFIMHNEGKIVVPKSQSEYPEYQYQLKDHLGNVRLTFTTKEKTEVFRATMEDTGIADYSNPRVREMEHFGNLFETEIRNVNQWLNHTSTAIGNAIYLDGSEDKTIGPYIMLKVYPGDTVNMEVYGKFQNKSSHSTMPLIDLLVALANPVQTAAIGFEGGGTWSAASFFEGLIPFLNSRSTSSDVPAAYLNFILFDKDFNVVDLGFDRIDESAGFNVNAENTVPFDKMQLGRIIDRVGYLYVFVSNESEGTRVWMDDIKITYGQSPIVQFEDYYPFGLSISGTAFERGNDSYKGMVTADGTGLKDLGFRQYDPVLGRFHTVDPLAELQADQSTYQYAGNNPVSQIDVLGLEADDIEDEYKKKKWKDKDKKDKRRKHKEQTKTNGQRVKFHNGFVNKPDRRSSRATNQRNKEQARVSRREQRHHRREEQAKNKEEGKKNDAQTTAAKNSSSNRDPNLEQRTQVNMLFFEPQLYNAGENDVNRQVFNHGGNTPLPRFENSITPPGTFDKRDDSDGMSSLVYAANLGRNATNVEQYRQYLFSHLSTNEARALYYRMLVNINYNYRTDNLVARVRENLATVSNTLPNVASVWDPQEPVRVTLTNGGIILSHDGADGILKELSVVIKRPDDLQYNVLDVMIGEATFTEDSPELMQIFKRGAEYAEQLLKDEEQRLKFQENRDGFASRSEIEQFLLSKQNDIKNYMENLRDQVAVGNVQDFVGISAIEKQALQTSIDKFRNEQSLDAEVKILDKEFFERLKVQYENGDRIPDKDVTLLMTRDPQGNIEKHFVYKDGLFVLPTEKEVNGEIIVLEGTIEEFETVRDRFIESAINYDNIQLYDNSGNPINADAEELVVGKDANGIPVTINSSEEPYLNIFEKAMWVITASRDLLSEVGINEKRWNENLNQNTWPVYVPDTGAGMGNAVLDEAKSIPEMVAFGLSMFDKQVRQSLWESITDVNWDTFKHIFIDKAEQYENTPVYAGSYDVTTIIIAVLTGGKKVFDELSDVLKKSGKIGEINWNFIRTKNLPDDQVERLAKDIADNEGMQDLFKNSPDVVDGWKKLDALGNDVPQPLRRDAGMVQSFSRFDNNLTAKKHIFEGEINSSGNATGVHHINAIQGGTARKIEGTQISGPNGLYKARIEVKDANDNWIPKTSNNGYSTFFPDNWSVDRAKAEIAHAHKNATKIAGTSNTYRGYSIDGSIEINMFLNSNGDIISAFPVF